MSIHLYEWRAAFDRGRAQTEIVGKAEGYAAQIEHTMREDKLSMIGVGGMCVIVPCPVAKFGVTKQKKKCHCRSEWQQERGQLSQPISRLHPEEKKSRD